MRSPMKSIGDHCRECAGTFLDVKFCSDPDCALWEYRFGRHDAALHQYGPDIFRKENFREGGKFEPGTDARVLQARFFPVGPQLDKVKPAQNRLSEANPAPTTGEPPKPEISLKSAYPYQYGINLIWRRSDDRTI